MENEEWAVVWLTKLKNDGGNFVKLLKGTKRNVHSYPIHKLRTDFSVTLNGAYDPNSPESVMTWVRAVWGKLKRLETFLLPAEESAAFPKLARAYGRAKTLSGRIESTIGMLERALNEREK